MSSKQSLAEILEELKAAEERWQDLLKNAKNDTKHLKKPDILYVGPRPITKVKVQQVKEPVIPVVPIPKIKKNRGDFVSRMKTQLKLLKNELSWNVSAARKNELIEKITKTKSEIKYFKKNKRYGKYTNKN